MSGSGTFVFRTVYHALAFYNFKNPARQKSINLFEPDRHLGAEHQQTDSADIWAAVCLAINKVMQQTRDVDSRIAFRLHYLGDPQFAWSKEDIAKITGRSLRHVNRKLRRMLDDLEDELIRRGLLDAVQR